LHANISHFGNSNKYDQIDVLINDETVDRDNFLLFGLKSEIDIGLTIRESFTLVINLKKERFEELATIVKNDLTENISISVWLGNHPGLYSK